MHRTPGERRTPYGGTIRFRAGPGRGLRVLELDRYQAPVATLCWDTTDALTAAAVRTASGAWIAIEPRAASHWGWGLSDRLWLLSDGPGGAGRQPLTVFEALDWAAIDHIPPLAEPARLPPGAGTAVLNLVAALAADQEIARLRYHGPYPTEALFLALLEAFRYVEGDRDPLDRFRAGQLDWAPAPHERHFEPSGAAVQLRDGVEKVVWRGQAYYRTDWQSVARWAPGRVHERGGTVRCSLWALGAVIEDHLVLDPAGHVLRVLEAAPDPRHAVPLSPEVQAGLVALVRAQSAPALAGAVAAEMAALAIEWAGLAGGLVEVTGARARLARTLADVGGARIQAARSPAERLGRALELLVEMARLLGDPVRARAQARLAELPPAAQPTALAAGVPAADPATIAAATAALAAQFCRR
jgi:hypothetical protein